jgi:hypothetical protein
MNDLVTTAAAGPRGLYQRMQGAITRCYSVDDCVAIADQAAAIAAYYKQIKDDRSVVEFGAIKLRAWRRIGEICAQVDDADCENRMAYYDKINTRFPNLHPDHIAQALKLAKLPEEFFEETIMSPREGVSGRVLPWTVQDLLTEYTRWKYENTPDGAAVAETVKRAKAAKAKEVEGKKQDGRALSPEEIMDDTMASYREAYTEVGYTMDRRDRKTMRTVVLLVKQELHATLRQAGFDHHRTMQSIIREGLLRWLKEHHYDIPE